MSSEGNVKGLYCILSNGGHLNGDQQGNDVILFVF